MNHRWQKLVMYLTASVIICLQVYGHLQKQSALHQRAKRLSYPDEIPEGFLWPKEIQNYHMQISRWERERTQREMLLFRASGQDFDLSLERSIQNYIDSYPITTFFAPQSKEENPKLWNLALTGLEYQRLANFDVMTYELTYATTWFLGFPVSKDNLSCPFCPIVLNFETAQKVADRISKSMNLSPCYEQNIPLTVCKGWRLPTKQEWFEARGREEQKWMYLHADLQNIEKGREHVGRGGANENGLFDIVGSQEEWLQTQESIGRDVEGLLLSSYVSGVRFYRTKEPIEAEY